MSAGRAQGVRQRGCQLAGLGGLLAALFPFGRAQLVLGGVPALREGLVERQKARGQQCEHGVLRREFLRAGEAAAQLASQGLPAAAQGAANGAAQRGGGAQRQARQCHVGHRADARANGRAQAQAAASFFEQGGVEQVVLPALGQLRQAGGFGVFRPEGVRAQQRLRGPAGMGRAVLLEGVDEGVAPRRIGVFACGDGPAHGGHADKGAGDGQARGALAVLRLLLKLAGNVFKLAAALGQQRGQVAVQRGFGPVEGSNGVKRRAGVQARIAQGGAPAVLAAASGAHEIEHGHDGARTPGQRFHFGTVFGQHGRARVDDEHGRVCVFKQGAQHFGFLLEAGMRFGAAQKGAHAVGAAGVRGQALGGQLLQVVEQRHGVFQARRVEKAHGHFALQQQVDALDVPRDAGPVRDFAKRRPPRERAQKRGFARVRVAHHGNPQGRRGGG